jgi:hypothetical protein
MVRRYAERISPQSLLAYLGERGMCLRNLKLGIQVKRRATNSLQPTVKGGC